jgi:uncharacterized protein YdeI (YjbR/CyaY-like superfamily)
MRTTLVGFHKTGSGQPCMRWPESVDEALCFGWIDGRRKRIDDKSYLPQHRPHWITSAKREETRGKRLAQLMQACAAGKRLT